MAKRDKKKMGIRLNVHALPKIDNLPDFLILKKRDQGLMIGHNIDTALMNLAIYGSMDPDTELLHGVSKELWEAAIPRFDSRRAKSVGIPMIFGTGGSDSPSMEYYKKMVLGDWKFQDVFIPAENINPIARESATMRMSNSVENFDMIPVDSSNIKAIGYSEGVIRIEFVRGAVYEYSACTKEEFVQAVNASSVSGWFNTIKNSKPYKQVK